MPEAVADTTLECPVCRDYLSSPQLTNCGHVFCAGCIHEWGVQFLFGAILADESTTQTENVVSVVACLHFISERLIWLLKSILNGPVTRPVSHVSATDGGNRFQRVA